MKAAEYFEKQAIEYEEKMIEATNRGAEMKATACSRIAHYHRQAASALYGNTEQSVTTYEREQALALLRKTLVQNDLWNHEINNAFHIITEPTTGDDVVKIRLTEGAAAIVKKKNGQYIIELHRAAQQ